MEATQMCMTVKGGLILPSLMPSSVTTPAHIQTDSHIQRCRPCLRAIEMEMISLEGLQRKPNGFLYKLAKNKEGFLEKEAMRGLYDGSLFVYFENQHNAYAQPR